MALFFRHIPPAEDTLVSTGEAGRSLHAPVGLNTIESVLVTTSSPSQHWLKDKNNTMTTIHAFFYLLGKQYSWHVLSSSHCIKGCFPDSPSKKERHTKTTLTGHQVRISTSPHQSQSIQSSKEIKLAIVLWYQSRKLTDKPDVDQETRKEL